MGPAGERAPANKPANGSGASDLAKLAELRRLLIGERLDQVDALARRLDDPNVRAAETADVLPDAVKSASGKRLRESFEPLFERLFKNSVIKHPRDISDAISPVMGPAIRNYVAAAIREFAESLNQIVEKSASWRALRWRIEARVTGRSFTELLLSRSLLYSVEQVFLIHRKSGILLAHAAAEGAVVKDADMMSGMLSAIQDFVSDSFSEAGQSLETIDAGRYKLWIQHGSQALLVGAVSGTAPVELKNVFRAALDRIQEELLGPLESFKQGDLSVFEPARPHLESCLLGRKAPDRHNRGLLWIFAVVLIALIGALLFWQIRNMRRWDAYVDELRRQPGIYVVHAERSGMGGRIEGLKDPQAPNPDALAASFQVDASKIAFNWQPFLSLNTPFASARALQADVDAIQGKIIRFEIGSSKLPIGEVGQIDELAASILRVLKSHPAARIRITGHTDEIGSANENVKLSMDRAVTIRQALIAQGIPVASIDVTGAGNTQPLRSGGTEWDQAANRSVSIRVDAR
jgi:OOP family OmpA-OmpF porin